MQFFLFPLDVLENIFFFIPSGEVYKISLLSRRGRKIIDNDFWIRRASRTLNISISAEFKEFFNMLDAELVIKYYRIISFGFKVEPESIIYLPPQLAMYYAIFDDNYPVIPYYIDFIVEHDYGKIVELCIFLRRYKCLLYFLENILVIDEGNKKDKIIYKHNILTRSSVTLTFQFIKFIPEDLRKKIVKLILDNGLDIDSTHTPSKYLRDYINNGKEPRYMYNEISLYCNGKNYKESGLFEKNFKRLKAYLIDSIENLEELDTFIHLHDRDKFMLALNWACRNGNYRIENKINRDDIVPGSREIINNCLYLEYIKYPYKITYDETYLKGYFGIEGNILRSIYDYTVTFYELKNNLFNNSLFNNNINMHFCGCCNHYCRDISHISHKMELVSIINPRNNINMRNIDLEDTDISLNLFI